MTASHSNQMNTISILVLTSIRSEAAASSNFLILPQCMFLQKMRNEYASQTGH